MKHFLILIFIISVFACQSPAALVNNSSQMQKQKPNIIVIMADDIGLGDIGYYHRQRTGETPLVRTPNIDKMIERGMRFSDAHSPASLCAPTRFSMLTGNYSYRNSSHPWGVWQPATKTGIEPNYTTAARIAKEGGYATAFLGKWGLGGEWNAWPDDLSGYEEMDKGAQYFGFDYSLELPQGIQNIPYAFYENGKFMKLQEDSKIAKIPFEQLKYHSEKRRIKGGSVADSNWDSSLAGPILANKAAAYIKEQAKSKIPFYMYYCSQAVHIPHNPPKEFNGENISGSTLGRHGDMIKELDVQIGMIIKSLEENGLFDNTLLVFTSDNGGLNRDKALVNAGHESSNGLRGQKASIYEGGHRVPFIAVWPGVIQPNSQSSIPIVAHDMVATIANIAEVPVDKSKLLDAANLLPIFEQGSEKPLHKYLMHQSKAKGGPFYAIREGDWKLIVKENESSGLENSESIALYNLSNNVTENKSDNHIDNPAYQNKIEQLKLKLLELRNGNMPTVF